MCQSRLFKAFPPECVVGFTSGTGFAGIAGSGTWLIFKTIGISSSTAFLILSPIGLLYAIAFWWVYSQGLVENDRLLEPIHQNNEGKDKKTIAESVNEYFSVGLLKNVWKKSMGLGKCTWSGLFFRVLSASWIC
jgi:hypothetical protein